MCIPTPPTPAPPANETPSMQSADNLQLGGSDAPRGAAAIGRLMLRLGGNPTGQAPAPAPTASAASNAPAISGLPSLNLGSIGGSSGFNSVPNISLRLGNAGSRP